MVAALRTARWSGPANSMLVFAGMQPRRFLIALLLSVIVSASPALAQDKGTVDAKPLPPLKNPNDPKLGAKELFARKYLPGASEKPRVIGFYAHGCIAEIGRASCRERV